jgi:hypothetical protein
MNFQKIKEVVFPFGNAWFYPVSLIWILSTAVFYISFPALLTASHIQVTGFSPTNLPNSLIDLSSDLLSLALALMRTFLLFLIASAIFDGIEDYKVGRRKRGYL